jgi:hypothetical protein
VIIGALTERQLWCETPFRLKSALHAVIWNARKYARICGRRRFELRLTARSNKVCGEVQVARHGAISLASRPRIYRSFIEKSPSFTYLWNASKKTSRPPKHAAFPS